MTDSPKILPLGENCVTVDFGNEISLELNSRALQLAAHLESKPFPGFIESVAAYSSVSIFYNLSEVRRSFLNSETAFNAVRDAVTDALNRRDNLRGSQPRLIEILVDFSPGAALDLESVSRHAGLSPAEVIELFTGSTYHVYMLGFLPGFAYMGTVDERIAAPRKDSPRLKVPKGSVGIAGRQTGIYPFESPGGWQIIGRTDIEMFAPAADPPCQLTAGDQVRFVSLA